MIIEMLSTGDEVLQGDILDSNAAWLGQCLHEHGLRFSLRQTVADVLSDIVDALDLAASRADWVIVNGGLGPTIDDLSAQAASELTGQALEYSAHWLARLTTWYQQAGKAMPESNRKQALLPSTATLIDNPIGTACGFMLKHRGATLFFTPGVPREFKHMVNTQLLPRLNGTAKGAITKRFYTFGLSESWLSDRLDTQSLPKGLRLGYRSARPHIEVKLLSEQNSPAFHQASQDLAHALGDFVFSENEANWPALVGRLLREQNLRLSVAESCSGGLLASELIDVAGSSAYFERGFVTYSNDAKIEALGVSAALIEKHGAVSMPVAQAMAQGALAHSHGDIALAITGIAGPEGGSEQKPVGTVCFALATKHRCYVQHLLIANRDRRAVRVLSVYVALDMLRRHLQGLKVCVDYPAFSQIDVQSVN